MKIRFELEIEMGESGGEGLITAFQQMWARGLLGDANRGLNGGGDEHGPAGGGEASGVAKGAAVVSSPGAAVAADEGGEKAIEQPAVDWGVVMEGTGVWATVVDLEADAITWRQVAKEVRLAISREVMRYLSGGGETLTQKEFDRRSPRWMPAAATLPDRFGVRWDELVRQVKASPDPVGAPSPEKKGGVKR